MQHVKLSLVHMKKNKSKLRVATNDDEPTNETDGGKRYCANEARVEKKIYWKTLLRLTTCTVFVTTVFPALPAEGAVLRCLALARRAAAFAATSATRFRRKCGASICSQVNKVSDEHKSQCMKAGAQTYTPECVCVCVCVEGGICKMRWRDTDEREHRTCKAGFHVAAADASVFLASPSSVWLTSARASTVGEGSSMISDLCSTNATTITSGERTETSCHERKIHKFYIIQAVLS